RQTERVKTVLEHRCKAGERYLSALDGGGGGELVQSRDKKGQKWKQREGERPPAFVAVASVVGTARYTALYTSTSLAFYLISTYETKTHPAYRSRSRERVSPPAEFLPIGTKFQIGRFNSNLKESPSKRTNKQQVGSS
ncbi:unnamed protein product, partial [Heterotrigona itama]